MSPSVYRVHYWRSSLVQSAVHLRADRRASYDRIAEVLSAGVVKIGLSTEPAKER